MKKGIIAVTMLFCLIVLVGRKANAQTNSGNLLLESNFWAGNPSVSRVKELIDKGNSPTEMGARGFDPIATAILANAPLDDIKYLVKAASNKLEVKTHDGRTYLFWAAVKGNFPLVKYLVNEGANVNAVDDHGLTILFFAAAKGEKDLKFYNFMINHGTDITQTNNVGANVLFALMPTLKDPSLIDYFESKGLSVKAKDKEGNNAFFYAAKGGNVEMMKELIKRGVDCKAKNKLGENAIFYASKGGRGVMPTLEAFEFMKSKGIKVNTVSAEGKTPVINLAANCKDLAVFKFFVNEGVDPNAMDQEGNNALIEAAGKNNIEVIKYLAEKTADINHANNIGETAIMKSVEQNTQDVIEYLVNKGADVKAVDKKGNSLVYYIVKSAKSGGGFGWAKAPQGGRPGGSASNGMKAHQEEKAHRPEGLNHEGGQHGGFEHAHGWQNNSEENNSLETKVNFLTQNGLNLKQVQAEGNTMLHLAATQGNKELIKKGIIVGIDINAKNNNGETALHLAALKAKDVGLLKMLVHFGADKTIQTAFGETAYQLASENETLKSNAVDLNFLK